jgi:putative transcriptional regulator
VRCLFGAWESPRLEWERDQDLQHKPTWFYCRRAVREGSRNGDHGIIKRMKKSPRTRVVTEGKSDEPTRSTDRCTVSAEIMEALEEVRESLRSGEPVEQRFTVRSYWLEFAMRDYGPDDVQAVRQLLGLSQPRFASFLGVDVSTVRSWEQGIRSPSSIARRFMDEIATNPVYWQGRLRESSSEASP